MADKDLLANRKKEISVVAEDQNWRSYIKNELDCAEMWQKDWGFLGEHEDKDFADRVIQGPTIEEKIKKLESQLKEMNDKKCQRLQTTAKAFGSGDDMETFRMKHLNKRKQHELMPVPRRPK